MHKELFKLILVIFSFSVVLLSCNTNDPFQITPPTFDSVPTETPITGITPIEIDEGIKAYIHEEGSDKFFVTDRDEIQVYITLRTDEGEIIYSSFQNNRQEPSNISMRRAGEFQNDFFYTVAQTFTPGLRRGLIGMNLGEFRTLVVSPEKGYKNVQSGFITSQYRDNTLYYEIRLSRIMPD